MKYQNLELDPFQAAAVEAISRAELMIVGGTSLAVYPAAGLLNYFSGKHLVIINKSETPGDDMAQLVIHEPIGKVLNKVILCIRQEIL